MGFWDNGLSKKPLLAAYKIGSYIRITMFSLLRVPYPGSTQPDYLSSLIIILHIVSNCKQY